MKYALVVAFALAFAGPARGEIKPGPKGWYLFQVVPGEYTLSLDKAGAHAGKASAKLASATAAPTKYGLIGQVVNAAPYRGKRVRFSAFVRTDKVAKWAGLFMRVDSPDKDPKHALALDAMDRRPIRGTTRWTRHAIVLDVGDQASQIALGGSLTGAGTMWIDAVTFEVVDKSVPTTDHKPPDRPLNADFED